MYNIKYEDKTAQNGKEAQTGGRGAHTQRHARGLLYVGKRGKADELVQSGCACQILRGDFGVSGGDIFGTMDGRKPFFGRREPSGVV